MIGASLAEAIKRLREYPMLHQDLVDAVVQEAARAALAVLHASRDDLLEAQARARAWRDLAEAFEATPEHLERVVRLGFRPVEPKGVRGL